MCSRNGAIGRWRSPTTLKAARVAVGEKAAQLDLPLENLLTPESLRRLAWSPPDPVTPEAVDAALEALGARQWQRENTAQLIATAFVESAFVEADQTPSDEAPPAS